METELEVRAFITESQFNSLLEFLENTASFLEKDYQVTFWMNKEGTIRIRKTNNSCSLISKKGLAHDNKREEIEAQFNKECFDDLVSILEEMGHGVAMKWFRTRQVFEWKNCNVMLDFTRGYGYTIEIQKMTTQDNKEEILEELRKLLKELKIEETPKNIFDQKLEFYLKNWRDLV